jgi:hypothetical protein
MESYFFSFISLHVKGSKKTQHCLRDLWNIIPLKSLAHTQMYEGRRDYSLELLTFEDGTDVGIQLIDSLNNNTIHLFIGSRLHSE